MIYNHTQLLSPRSVVSLILFITQCLIIPGLCIMRAVSMPPTTHGSIAVSDIGLITKRDPSFTIDVVHLEHAMSLGLNPMPNATC
jgi:hypothetical protein